MQHSRGTNKHPSVYRDEPAADISMEAVKLKVTIEMIQFVFFKPQVSDNDVASPNDDFFVAIKTRTLSTC